MKKLLSLFFLALLTTIAAAQISKTINVTTAGTLSTLLTATEKTTVTNLTVTGNIDARDFVTMRDAMPVLAVLNISGVSIKAYSGTAGTYYYGGSYPANEMPQYSFYNSYTGVSNASLKSITLPTTITSIGFAAFDSCSGLNVLTLGSGVTSIADYAFSSCYNLKIINSLSSTPPTLGNSSFQGLTIVYVPSTAVTLYKAAPGWSAFTIATEKHVTINNPVAGSLANAIITGGYGPLSSITHLTVTGNLNSVDISQMNTNMTLLTFIDISGATLATNNLPANAFQNKTMLTSIALPASLLSIGDYAFSNCTLLSGVIPIPAAVTSIGSYAFQYCTALIGTLTLPAGLKAINSYAFAGCAGLTGTLTIPGSVTSIQDGAFQSCQGFTGNLAIPNSVTTIGNYAFQYCSGFTGTLTLPNAITTVSYNAFYGCTGLSGVLTIPLSVKSISDYAFNGCAGFTQVIINKNVTSIGDYAFYNCSGLQKISVAQSVPPTIYANTFTGVSRETTTLEIPVGSSVAYETANYWSLFIILSETIMADTYGITLQIGAGGGVKESNVSLGNGSVLMVNKGTTKTFTLVPSAGYNVATASYGGVDVKSQIVNNQYTTAAVNANTTLSVTFVKVQYKISIQTGGSGVMNLYYDYGSTPSFDFTPSVGSKIQTVYYNGTDITSSLVGSVCTVPAITANSTLVVNFVTIATGSETQLEKQVKVYALHSEIMLEGIQEGETVTLYSLNGAQLQSAKSHGERMILQAKPNAVYLVRTASKTYKVIL